MKVHEATEQAYKNGYKKGYEEGFKEGYEGGFDVGKRNAVKHGRWVKLGKHDWACSVCKIGVPYYYTGHHYCPNCGADMRGEKDGKE